MTLAARSKLSAVSGASEPTPPIRRAFCSMAEPIQAGHADGNDCPLIDRRPTTRSTSALRRRLLSDRWLAFHLRGIRRAQHAFVDGHVERACVARGQFTKAFIQFTPDFDAT